MIGEIKQKKTGKRIILSIPKRELSKQEVNLNDYKKTKTSQYLTLNVNPTLLVFNIETSRKLVDVPETRSTKPQQKNKINKTYHKEETQQPTRAIINNNSRFGGGINLKRT